MTSLGEVVGNVGGQRRLADTTLVVEQTQRANLRGYDLPQDVAAEAAGSQHFRQDISRRADGQPTSSQLARSPPLHR